MWYPFDQQVCCMEMLSDGELETYVNLLKGGVEFSGKKELTLYFIKSYMMNKRTIRNREAVVISITLGRRLLGTFSTVFFPTILLNVIGYSTNFFKEFFFEVNSIHI